MTSLSRVQSTPRPDAALTNRNVMLLREALGNVELSDDEALSLAWLAQWETSTVEHVVSAFSKARPRR